MLVDLKKWDNEEVKEQECSFTWPLRIVIEEGLAAFRISSCIKPTEEYLVAIESYVH
jgi:hypothetical protein